MKYWPENGEKHELGILEVTHTETQEFEDHMERKFDVKNTRVSVPNSSGNMSIDLNNFSRVLGHLFC